MIKIKETYFQERVNHKILIFIFIIGRTILLTTHHLDEADILSDRVAILHKVI